MARYVTLIQFTDQGARGIARSADRAGAFAKAAKKAGITVEAQLWTAGAYDGILILSGKNERKLLQILTKLAATGNVRTQTMPAFNAREFAKLVAG